MREIAKKIIHERLLHYAIAGGTSFATEYTTFLILYYAVHLSAVAANTASYLLALTVNFSLNKLWVFGARRHDRRITHQFLIYGAIAAINLLITDVAIHYLVRDHVPAFVAKIMLVVLVASWNFLVFKRFIFASTGRASA